MNPIVTVSSNDQQSFQRYCLEYVLQGYILSSSNCSTATFQGQTDEFWQAVFVLPSAKG